MRPRGELRVALAVAAAALVPGPGQPGVTWRQLVRHACVGELMGRRTVENMITSGELRVVGSKRVQGCNRPVRLLAPAALLQPAAHPLEAAMGAWLAQA